MFIVHRNWVGFCLVLLLGAATAGAGPDDPSLRTVAAVSGARPSPDGYFHLRPVGSWSGLPGDKACAARVHRSTWEIRPQNFKENHTMPNPAKVHRAFADRRRAGVSDRWNRWLLPRVDGQFTGTTDEILQWAACKWGLPDNLLRAIAVRESSWYNYLHYVNGKPVQYLGSGDIVSNPSKATGVFCDGLSQVGGVDYQRWYGNRRCPETFSIVGIKAWEDPSWGRWFRNQNGTFAFSRDSTAFAADYIGSQLRGCYEGWQWWLKDTGDHSYGAGDLWGCVGAWYAGAWRTQAARGYAGRVQGTLKEHHWLWTKFAAKVFDCDPHLGCPV